MEGPRLQGGELVVAQVQFPELAQAGEHSLLKPPQAVPTQVQELGVSWESPRDSLQSPVGAQHGLGVGGAVTHGGAGSAAPHQRQEEQEKDGGPWGPGLLWSCGHSHALFAPGTEDDMALFGNGSEDGFPWASIEERDCLSVAR